MENDNKDKAVLTEEELKAVTGGASSTVLNKMCNAILDSKKCDATPMCIWINKCIYYPQKA